MDEKGDFLSIDIVKEFLRLDDDDASIPLLISTAEEYIVSATGNFNRQSKKAQTLGLLIISDMYDNRQLSDAANTRSANSRNFRKLIDDMILQLKLETSDNNGI